MRIACTQLNVSDSPADNWGEIENLVRNAAAGGAKLVFTPECTNLISANRDQLREVVETETDDKTLRALKDLAEELKIEVLVGSLCLANDQDRDQVAVNRQFLINSSGHISARYDKIHMFDVDVGDGQHYRESELYRAGNTQVVSDLGNGFTLGHAICYDLRFPYHFATLAQAGANIITVPAAFTHVTGQAHWRALLRARAIETASWVVAPAQCGIHANGRQTWGHSLVVSPWGAIQAEASEDRPGVIFADLNTEAIKVARDSIPILRHHRAIESLNLEVKTSFNR